MEASWGSKAICEPFDFDALLYDKEVLGALLILKITFEWLDVVLHNFFDVEICSRAKEIFLSTLYRQKPFYYLPYALMSWQFNRSSWPPPKFFESNWTSVDYQIRNRKKWLLLFFKKICLLNILLPIINDKISKYYLLSVWI